MKIPMHFEVPEGYVRIFSKRSYEDAEKTAQEFSKETGRVVCLVRSPLVNDGGGWKVYAQVTK